MAEHPFDFLGRWSRLDDIELATLSTPDNCALLSEIVSLLEEPSSVQQTIISQDNFCDVVRRMRKVYEVGSTKLSRTIIYTRNLSDQGFREEANECFNKFINECPSPFYKNIAKNCISK